MALLWYDPTLANKARGNPKLERRDLDLEYLEPIDTEAVLKALNEQDTTKESDNSSECDSSDS
jgi:hypothetical protein